MLRCQSCGMPLDGDNKMFGTNADGSLNSEFCKYCYNLGKFTSDVSLGEMVEKCASHLLENNHDISQSQAREMMTEILPTLKRWPDDENLIKKIEGTIKELEEKLRKAMQDNDAETLEELISDELIFVAPAGEIITKQMDLQCHKSGIQRTSKLTPSEQTIKINGDNAIVTVKMHILGAYDGVDISGSYRYLRVWQNTNSKWQIIAGSATQIN